MGVYDFYSKKIFSKEIVNTHRPVTRSTSVGIEGGTNRSTSGTQGVRNGEGTFNLNLNNLDGLPRVNLNVF